MAKFRGVPAVNGLSLQVCTQQLPNTGIKVSSNMSTNMEYRVSVGVRETWPLSGESGADSPFGSFGKLVLCLFSSSLSLILLIMYMLIFMYMNMHTYTHTHAHHTHTHTHVCAWVCTGLKECECATLMHAHHTHTHTRVCAWVCTGLKKCECATLMAVPRLLQIIHTKIYGYIYACRFVFAFMDSSVSL